MQGCDDCTLVCPIEQKSEFDMGLGNRHAVYKPYAQAAPNKVVIDKRAPHPVNITALHISMHTGMFL